MRITKYLLLILIVALISVNQTNAQGNSIKVDSIKHWDINGNFGLNFNQVSFVDWAKGGENSISGTSFANLYANYKKNRWEWMNYLLMTYGLMQQGNDDAVLKKIEDRIELNSKIGYKQWENLYWSFNMNFKTQFAPGYQYPNDSVKVSEFLSPAYLILSLGIDYKPNNYLSISFSPLAGRFIFVGDTIYSTRYGLPRGETAKYDFGWYFTANYKHDSIFTNVGVASKLSLFQNYTDKNVDNRMNIDVDWQTQFLFKINTWLSASFNFHLIYDHDIQIPIYDTVKGKKTLIGTGPRTQFMQQLGIGIVYKF